MSTRLFRVNLVNVSEKKICRLNKITELVKKISVGVESREKALVLEGYIDFALLKQWRLNVKLDKML